ncbi:MAG: phage tail tape measure protein [Lamprocystis purpurea]|nr:phage tail tape measure protein [Lamprocystis purpurea]
MILQAVSGATAAELANLKAQAEGAGAAGLADSAAEAAAGQVELARAGQSAKDVMASLPAVLATATAGEMDVAEAAGFVTQVLAAFNLAADQSGRVADVLAKGADDSKTSIRGIGEALSYVGPAALAFGYSLEETVSYIEALATKGIDASRAGTGLASIMSQIADPSTKAAGALEDAGIESKKLGEVLTALAKGGPMAEAAILAFGLEAGPALRSLIATGTAGIAELQASLRESGGYADQAAAAITNNFLGALKPLGGAIKDVRNRIGEGLLGPLEYSGP